MTAIDVPPAPAEARGQEIRRFTTKLVRDALGLLDNGTRVLIAGAVYLRRDESPRRPDRVADPRDGGDWWQLDGTPKGRGPLTATEVFAPAEERCEGWTVLTDVHDVAERIEEHLVPPVLFSRAGAEYSSVRAISCYAIANGYVHGPDGEAVHEDHPAIAAEIDRRGRRVYRDHGYGDGHGGAPVIGCEHPDAGDRTVAAIAIRDFVRSLRPSTDDEPEDGSMIVVDEIRAYMRSDQEERPAPSYDVALGRDVSEPGDWWPMDGADTGRAERLEQILDLGHRASDDPPRQSHDFDIAYTSSNLVQIAEFYIEHIVTASANRV